MKKDKAYVTWALSFFLEVNVESLGSSPPEPGYVEPYFCILAIVIYKLKSLILFNYYL
ncbi:hypothetical protein [Bacillus sp. EB106-08-02-XG196]|uniref:hypothetical protein n=1 Tax=Bacillus sp. EB106-08-02-XG196 TaxID=2737049 RepID=UPI001C4F75BF|nr:hypothetical protein [Bacillus sp. EB106-08-02-XG196]